MLWASSPHVKNEEVSAEKCQGDATLTVTSPRTDKEGDVWFW